MLPSCWPTGSPWCRSWCSPASRSGSSRAYSAGCGEGGERACEGEWSVAPLDFRHARVHVRLWVASPPRPRAARQPHGLAGGCGREPLYLQLDGLPAGCVGAGPHDAGAGVGGILAGLRAHVAAARRYHALRAPLYCRAHRGRVPALPGPQRDGPLSGRAARAPRVVRRNCRPLYGPRAGISGRIRARKPGGERSHAHRGVHSRPAHRRALARRKR